MLENHEVVLENDIFTYLVLLETYSQPLLQTVNNNKHIFVFRAFARILCPAALRTSRRRRRLLNMANYDAYQHHVSCIDFFSDLFFLHGYYCRTLPAKVFLTISKTSAGIKICNLLCLSLILLFTAKSAQTLQV